MRLIWFIALQFLREYRAQAALTVAAVGVGVAVMIFLSALITGLQDSLIQKTLGTQPHITLRPLEEQPTPQYTGTGYVRRIQKAPQRPKGIDQWQSVLERVRADPSTRAAAPLASGDAFALRGNVKRPVAVLGTLVEQLDEVIPIKDRVLRGDFHLSGAEAAIGVTLADDLGVSVGDKMRLSTPDGLDTLVNIRAIFDLGSQQVNQRWVLLPLRTGQTLLGLTGGVNVIHVRIDEVFEAERIARRLEGNTGVEVESWMETSEQLLVALRSQSSSSYTIQFFIFLAVAMGISSVLVVSVVQRTREIGILRAMGISRRAIFLVFVLQGALIGAIGSVFGSAIGALLAEVFRRLAAAPDGSPTFPMALSNELFLLSSLIATITGVLAAALPARRASQLDPVEAIRHA